MSNKDKALQLVALGMYIFPCYSQDTWVGSNLHESKSPKTPNGFKDSTNDAKAVETWWTENPDDLIGVWCGESNIIVLDVDIDKDKGKDGQFELDENGMDVPPTFEYVTRRGGAHHIYNANGHTVGPTKNHVTDQGVILEGIDRRAGGSYVIWWGDVPASRDEFKDAPEWFLNASATATGAMYEGSVEEWLETIPQGAMDRVVQSAVDRIPTKDFGHDEMIRQQTNMVKYATEGHPGVDEALERLRDEWLRGPYNTAENERDWNTALAGAVAKYGGAETEEERDFWTRRPVLEHIHKSSRNLMASPWALLGGTILRTIHCIPSHVAYRSAFGPASLNSIAIFVGDSGGGKTLLQKQLDETFDFGMGFVAHEVGSGEAISEQYITDIDKATGIITWGNADHAEMFSFDEVGRLNAMAGRSGGTTVLEYFKTGWSGGTLGRKLVGGRGIEVPAYEYRLTAFLNAQPERADILLSDDEIEGGFPGRVLWVSLQDSTVVDEYVPGTPGQYKVVRPNWGTVKEITALPQMNAAHIQDRKNYHAGKRDKLDGHELMLKVRIAVGLAVLDGRSAVNDEDWELAEVVLNHSRTTRKMVQQKLVDKAIRDAEASGKAQGRRDAMAREAADDVDLVKARTQAAAAIEKLKAEGKNPTIGVVRSKMTRTLKPLLEDIWDELVQE